MCARGGHSLAGFQPDYLLMQARAIDDHVCYTAKAALTIYGELAGCNEL